MFGFEFKAERKRESRFECFIFMSDLPFSLTANPGMPNYLTVLGGLASVLFSLKTLPVSGGTPITSFVLQWRQQPTEEWKEITVPVSGICSSQRHKKITNLIETFDSTVMNE